MTNKDFYKFCKNQRKTEPDEHKKAVLADVYGFLWECGTTKVGVRTYIDHQIFVALHRGQGQPRIDAYRWLQSVFDGQVSTAPQQNATLFIDMPPHTVKPIVMNVQSMGRALPGIEESK
jgi:hypothetical protein